MHQKGLNRGSRMSSEGKSTETVIHEFLESIHEAIEKKIKMEFCLVHHTPYNVLNHNILLYKLDA
jgi:hypothetical protein